MSRDKSERLFEIIGQIDDSIIEKADADFTSLTKRRRVLGYRAKWGIAAAACLVVAFGFLLSSNMPQRGGAGMIMPAPAAAPAPPMLFGTAAGDAPAAEAAPQIALDEATWQYRARQSGDFYEADASPVTTAQAEELLNRMIVTTFILSAETMDFDTTVNFITSATRNFGGYIQNSSVDGRSIRFNDHFARSASFTVRIPSGSIHEFVSEVGYNTNIVSTQEHAEDITDSFFDSRARLASLINQESLLSALLENEGAGLEYILEVHRELASVRHQIELLHSSLQRMEQSVNYATAHINLHEVMQYRPVEAMPVTFSERINQNVSHSWDNFTRQMQNRMINIIWQLPFFATNMLIFALCLAVFWLIRKRIRKKRGKQPGESTFEWPASWRN